MKYILFIFLGFIQSVHAQKFTIKDSAGIIIVNIPSELKAYTYNKFCITENGMTIIAPEDSLDLYLKQVLNDKTYKLLFSGSNTFKKTLIRHKKRYSTLVGQPINFLVTGEDNYILLANKYICQEYIIDPTGNIEKRHRPENNNYIINKGFTYGFSYKPVEPGDVSLRLQLIGDSTIAETQNLLIHTRKAEINISAICSLIPQTSGSIIKYNLESTSQVLSDLSLELSFEVEINGFREILKCNTIFPKGNSRWEGELKRKVSGREPRSFVATKILIKQLSEDDNAIYIFR